MFIIATVRRFYLSLPKTHPNVMVMESIEDRQGDDQAEPLRDTMLR
jgi:hypothetical protein